MYQLLYLLNETLTFILNDVQSESYETITHIQCRSATAAVDERCRACPNAQGNLPQVLLPFLSDLQSHSSIRSSLVLLCSLSKNYLSSVLSTYPYQLVLSNVGCLLIQLLVVPNSPFLVFQSVIFSQYTNNI